MGRRRRRDGRRQSTWVRSGKVCSPSFTDGQTEASGGVYFYLCLRAPSLGLSEHKSMNAEFCSVTGSAYLPVFKAVMKPPPLWLNVRTSALVAISLYQLVSAPRSEWEGIPLVLAYFSDVQARIRQNFRLICLSPFLVHFV